MKIADNLSDRQILNFSGAMDGLDGETELYQDLLDSFFGPDGFSKDKLNTLIASGNLEEAAHYAHFHKGVSGMLGAELFFDALNTLDKIIRGKMEGDLEKAKKNVCSLYDETATALHALKLTD